MSLTNEQRRFLSALDKECTIERSTVSPGTRLDMKFSSPEEIATGVKCRLEMAKTSEDAVVFGPLPVSIATLVVPPDTDIKSEDVITVDSVEWVVRDPPATYNGRRAAHHIEAIVVKKVVV